MKDSISLRTSRILFTLTLLTLLLSCSASRKKLGNGVTEVLPSPEDSSSFSEIEIDSVTSQFIEFLDSSSRPASSVNLYGRRLASVMRPFRRIGVQRYDYRVYLSPKMNTFSLPDGSIRLTGGLMDLLSDDELIYLLAEQIALVEQGISTQRISEAYARVDVNRVEKLSSQELLALEEAFFHLSVPDQAMQAAREYAKRFLRNNRLSVDAASSAQTKLAALSAQSAYLRSYPTSQMVAEQRSRTGSERSPQVSSAPQTQSDTLTPPLEKIVTSERIDDEALPSPLEMKEEESVNVKVREVRTATLGASESVPQEPEKHVVPPVEEPVPQAEVLTPETEADRRPLVLETLLPGWYVQFAADTDRERAARRYQSAFAMKVPVQLQRAIVDGVEYYRALLGPYSSREAAEEARRTIESSKLTKGKAFFKRVN